MPASARPAEAPGRDEVPSGPCAGKRAVVTGAGTGIGRAVAAALAGAGARVALIGRRRELLEDAARSTGAPPGSLLVLAASVADRDAIRQAMEAVEAEWQGIDILVNNAGTNTPRRSLEEMDPGHWDEILQVNLTGVYNATRAALPALRRSGEGIVINVGSTAAFQASRLAGIAYTASKHGLAGFTAMLRLEERENGIRATIIHPGEVDTPLLEKRPEPVPQERRREILRPADVAEAVIFAATRPALVCVAEIIIEPR